MNFKGFDDWIPIFRGGKQIDSTGKEHDGDALIDKAVAGFNASKHEPPVVIGHPADNAPAWGWVEGLKKVGNELLAKFKQVQPDFAQMVADGLFKKRSAAFYPDGTLRHVGFLGAAAPAVKGLADVKFDDGEVITIEFAAPDAAKQAQEARAKKYGLSVKNGGNVTKPGQWASVPDEEFLDPVNYRYPCPDAEQTRAAAAYWGVAKNQEQYNAEEVSKMTERLDKFRKKFGIGQNEGGKKTMFQEKWQKILKSMGWDTSKIPSDAYPDDAPSKFASSVFTEADIEKAKQEAAEAAAKTEREKVTAEFAEAGRVARLTARKTGITAWCEQMVKDGKMTPAMVKYGIPEMLAAFAEKEDVMEFGEAKDKATLFDRFKILFEKEMPKVITFKEVATRDKNVGNAGTKMEALTREKMKANDKLTYGAAFAELQKENIELAQEYAQEMRGEK